MTVSLSVILTRRKVSVKDVDKQNAHIMINNFLNNLAIMG